MATKEELTVQLRKAIEERRDDDIFEIATKLVEPDLEGRDARQRAHLAEAEATEATVRSLPRVGATDMAWGLLHRAMILREMATMTEEEERAFRLEAEIAA